LPGGGRIGVAFATFLELPPAGAGEISLRHDRPELTLANCGAGRQVVRSKMPNECFRLSTDIGDFRASARCHQKAVLNFVSAVAQGMNTFLQYWVSHWGHYFSSRHFLLPIQPLLSGPPGCFPAERRRKRTRALPSSSSNSLSSPFPWLKKGFIVNAQ
jgi:hypothetical protein